MSKGIVWKEAARHFYERYHAHRAAGEFTARLANAEHEKRVTLVNAMNDLLPKIVDTHRCCIEARYTAGLHSHGCPYISALAAIAEAARSVEVS